MLKITPGPGHLLHNVAQTRVIEDDAQAGLPFNTLMQRAGLAVARLALASAPHARRIWLACGPGNNGGDGLDAAVQLLRLGKSPVVSWLGHIDNMPADTAAAYQRAMNAGICFVNEPDGDFDLCIDALLGIGARPTEPQGRMADWMQRLNASAAPVLAVDIPSGINADTGALTQLHVRASHTLSLLTLKPGLFTAHGRDASGAVWLDDLGIQPGDTVGSAASASLLPCPPQPTRLHGSNKGTYGDVAIVGGAPGMTGGALMAASAALHAGAGRVYVGLLDRDALQVNGQQPELMFRAVNELDFSHTTLVCGCGGGAVIHAHLSKLLSSATPVVIDADAINAIATDTALQHLVSLRATSRLNTVLTPHPLEAARLMGCSVAEIQQDRLKAAQTLSQKFACTVVLKGSGTVIAAPDQVLMINPTGNARLATAGTGDVLAGMIGTYLAGGATAFAAACHAVYRHGQIADDWPANQALTAGQLASRLSAI
jgi:hydroxyethylthiazole kinase-like uncharacterized protein yjeF